MEPDECQHHSSCSVALNHHYHPANSLGLIFEVYLVVSSYLYRRLLLYKHFVSRLSLILPAHASCAYILRSARQKEEKERKRKKRKKEKRKKKRRRRRRRRRTVKGMRAKRAFYFLLLFTASHSGSVFSHILDDSACCVWLCVWLCVCLPPPPPQHPHPHHPKQ